jgi:hypothetical protein
MGKKTAVVKMEEQYMRISINYEDKADRGFISEKIGEVEQQLKIFPDVLHKDINKSLSSFSIEFGGCEYVCSRESGDFIKLLIDKLGIVQCDGC